LSGGVSWGGEVVRLLPHHLSDGKARAIAQFPNLNPLLEPAEKVDVIQNVRIEAPEGRSLPALLAPQIRLALIRLVNPWHPD
jgi:hypothetical protein